MSSLLKFAGENRELVLSFMRLLLPSENDNFVLMDSTHVMSASGQLKESPKDIIELAKSVYQIRMHGEWKRSEIPQRVMKLFGKIKIDSLT